MLTYLAWVAIAVLGASHWLQVYKIHQHKEVRDIAIGTYVCLLVGYVILTAQAINEGSIIFFVRQIATIMPVSVILFQIWYHNRDRWHDDRDPYCNECGGEIELTWTYCPYCGDPTQEEMVAKHGHKWHMAKRGPNRPS
jgi:hypothetical protein